MARSIDSVNQFVARLLKKRQLLRLEQGVVSVAAELAALTACALGGDDGRTLYVTMGRVMVTPEQSRAARTGAILQLRTDAMLSPFANGSRA